MTPCEIAIPTSLATLLAGSPFDNPIRQFASQVALLVSDNKLDFFPDYTDHGIQHLDCVLRSAVSLIPKKVWTSENLLSPADAAVLIGATLLHDIAMHLRPPGFLELIHPHTRFKPVSWFSLSQENHTPDLPWPIQWELFADDARNFRGATLEQIIGPAGASAWRFTGLHPDYRMWSVYDRLIIGEFLRRHHARLAHEIALNGFPGLAAESGFPKLASADHALCDLSDLIGVVARSHWLPLRVGHAYIQEHPAYRRMRRPQDALPVYLMALLRIADYLQIQHSRAPLILLHLRDPRNSSTIRAWKQHRCVRQVGEHESHPGGISISVAPDVEPDIFIALESLIHGLQSELDHSAAVIGEIYGTTYPDLTLQSQRVYTNLLDKAFRDSLPYVPGITEFSVDPNLLQLLVGPLYGENPGVAIRELVQNAVDSVRELAVWCARHNVAADTLNRHKQDVDVAVIFKCDDNGRWFLRVSDRGVGMTADILRSFYMRAGASFKFSAEWERAYGATEGRGMALRTGRFGIGAFASFLLTDRFRLETRHVSGEGISIDIERNRRSHVIYRADNIPIGTAIELELCADAVKSLRLNDLDILLHKNVDAAARTQILNLVYQLKLAWYCYDWPTLRISIVHKDGTVLVPPVCTLLHDDSLPIDWFALPQQANAIRVGWTWPKDLPRLICNGIRIAEPDNLNCNLTWSLGDNFFIPSIRVTDEKGAMPIDIGRYGVTRHELPFEKSLVHDVYLSHLAYALVCGPHSRESAFYPNGYYPLVSRRGRGRRQWRDCVALTHWLSNANGFAIADPYLASHFVRSKCIVWGYVWQDRVPDRELKSIQVHDGLSLMKEVPAVRWDFDLDVYKAGHGPGRLDQLVAYGVPGLGYHSGATQVVAFASDWRDENLADMFNRNTKLASVGGGGPSWSGVFSHGCGTRVSAAFPYFQAFRQSSSEHWEKIVGGYMAKLTVTKGHPATPIGRYWRSVLGGPCIPFNMRERQQIIQQAKRRPRLRRHIEYWEWAVKEGIAQAYCA